MTPGSPENGRKLDAEKPPMDLLDAYALTQTALVLAFGAKKYGRQNWRSGIKVSRLIGAALRHIFSFLAGDDVDEETGRSPLAHAMCELMFALWMLEYRGDLDDRFRRPPTPADCAPTRHTRESSGSTPADLAHRLTGKKATFCVTDDAE